MTHENHASSEEYCEYCEQESPMTANEAYGLAQRHCGEEAKLSPEYLEALHVIIIPLEGQDTPQAALVWKNSSRVQLIPWAPPEPETPVASAVQ